MFIQVDRDFKKEVFISDLEKKMIREEIEHIIKKGGKYFTYKFCMHYETSDLGDIYNANFYKIGEVRGMLPIVLRALDGGKGVEPPKDAQVYPYVDDLFYPLEEYLKQIEV